MYLVGADAAGADFYGFHRTVLDGPDFLQIRLPYSTSFVVCVADIISGNGFFPADLTNSRHLYNPPESFERALLAYIVYRCKCFQSFLCGKLSFPKTVIPFLRNNAVVVPTPQTRISFR